MGVLTYESEITSTVAPARLFKAFVVDGDKLIPQIAPQAVKQIEILEGDGGAGTVKKIHFGEGAQFKYVKHKVNKVDIDSLTYSYAVIEGDVLSDKVEKIEYENKFVAAADGGTIIKNISKYHTIGEVEITEEQIKAGKDRAGGLFKVLEGYLHQNPDAYN
ncbi:major allergen Pru ar 1 [Ziziphus jujuba]|uniref:Major allergen Pru ar 1 n=1 Tax=Ziziphus jujuba TaxID=326968 RepID=R4L112_ZIZJJ|nr:major allergen Pru ar 1 [Ziziphus jujuba]AGL07712.1 pathogenesis related protein PR10 [Ziziphus jujuba]